MRGSKTKARFPDAGMLPPCRVCGEPGSGFHYGVTTCGACKGFFRRSLMRREPYECIKKPSCHIGPGTSRRESCPKCRYDRCLALGMSKDAIKIGRYTLTKRNDNIKQAKEQLILSGQSPTFHEQETKASEQHQAGGVSSSSSETLQYSRIIGNPDKAQLYSTNDGNALFCMGLDESNGPKINKYNNISIGSSYFNYAQSGSYDGDGDDDMCRFSFDESTQNRISTNPKIEDNVISNSDVLSRFRGDVTENSTPTCTVLNSSSPNCSNALDGRSLQTHQVNYPRPTSTCFMSGDATSNTITGRATDISCESPFCNLDKVSSSFEQALSSELFHSLQLNIDKTIQHTQQATQPSSPSNPPICPQSVENNTSLCDTVPNDIFLSLKTDAAIASTAVCPQPDQIISSSTNSSCNISTPFRELERSDGIVSLVSKSRHLDNILESELPTKIPRISGDFSQSIDSEKNKTTVSTLETNNSNQNRSFVIHIVAPDMMKYVLSFFDDFPFKSFEKQCLAPVLSICYGLDNSCAGEDLFRSLAKKKQFRSINQTSKAIPLFQPKSLPFCAWSSGQSLFTQDMIMPYDPTEMDRLFEYLYSAHCRYYGPKAAFMTENEKELAMEMYSKICQLYDLLLPKTWIDDDKYFAILDSTGVDVGKRKEWCSCFVEDSDTHFMKDIKFFRSLLKFKNLSINDRVALTKSSFIVLMKLRQTLTTDVERDMVIDEEFGVAARLSTTRQMLSPISFFLDEWTELARQMKRIDISFEELIVMRALILVCPDHCELENPKLVTDWHNTYLQCLLHLIRKTHGPNADDRFKKIFEYVQRVKKLVLDMEGRRKLIVDTVSRLYEGHDQQLFNEIFLGMP